MTTEEIMINVNTAKEGGIVPVSSKTAPEIREIMASIRTEVSSLISKSLGAFTNPNADPSYDKVKTMAENLAEFFNECSLTATFKECRDSADGPMMEAVRRYHYDFLTISEKEAELGGGKVKCLESREKPREIPLMRLSDFCGGIGVDQNWWAYAQSLNCTLTCAAGVMLGIKPDEITKINDSFKMAKIARDLKMHIQDPDCPDPIGKKSLGREIDSVLAKMLGEGYKCTTHDVNALLLAFGKRDKNVVRRLQTMKNADFISMIHDIAYGIVNHVGWSVKADVRKPKTSKSK